eukprot:scaffold113544_cov36-Prasinocladus_malaysianus.AAC.1
MHDVCVRIAAETMLKQQLCASCRAPPDSAPICVNDLELQTIITFSTKQQALHHVVVVIEHSDDAIDGLYRKQSRLNGGQ